MAHIVGIFENERALDGVIEQLELNGITEFVVMEPDGDVHAMTQQVRGFGVPDKQVEEYRTHLQNRGWLLFVGVSALELPIVQRALRSNEAVDIDLLPDAQA